MAISLTEGRTAQDWVDLVLAICLFISPWVVGFVADITPAWNAWIVGVVLGALTIAALSVFAEWEEWVNLVLGLWLIVSPWLLWIRRRHERDVDPCDHGRAHRGGVGLGNLGTPEPAARARVIGQTAR